MKIFDNFVGDNGRIKIISGNGKATTVPNGHKPILPESDILVAIPDMHMYHFHSPLDGFRHGAEAMLDFLLHLETRNRDWALEGRRLRIFQMGDLFELWFPNRHNGPRITSYEIWKSHPVYNEIGRLFRALKVRRLVGNHDHRRTVRCQNNKSFREENIHIEHGCNADPWYRFTNPENLFWRPAMSCFKAFRRFESDVKSMANALGLQLAGHHRAWYNDSGEAVQSDFPDPWEYPRHTLDYYSRKMLEIDNSNEAKLLCLVAHTHLPYLDTQFIGGRGIYLDAGAWSYGRTDFAVITSKEIAICHYHRAQQMQVAKKRCYTIEPVVATQIIQ